ncbi:RNA polymerase sigma factor [Anaerosporobacter faecicola]|uniref:RNA polymerase sigma factor n=1 Tax=Anaerosporobacter faecicola TaxID=2718714 RepID=UPI001EE57821|nr:RNA polymerase sigma factor [Anaerosporobacter faecicola]
MDKIRSQEKLRAWMEEYQNLIFSICCKMTGDYFIAEDLTQETFLSAYRNMDSFDGENLKAWLCRIATNKCLDYEKQAARRVIPSEETVFANIASEQNLPEQSMMEKEVIQQLRNMCEQLKPPYDEIASLYFCEEQKAEEIARLKEKNLKTIQTQIYRARAMLRKLYRKEHR